MKLQIDGTRLFAGVHTCDLVTFVMQMKSVKPEEYGQFCAGESPRLREVMKFWKGISESQLDEMAQHDCPVFRELIEPHDLLYIPAGMLVHERVTGRKISYCVRMGLMYSNGDNPKPLHHVQASYEI